LNPLVAAAAGCCILADQEPRKPFMHIPDGFIDAKTALVTTTLAAAGVGVALRQVRRELPPRRVPLLGLAAAFLFVAQMVNFPVAGGTSGHLIGGALVAVLLGPSAAVVVLTAVLIVQCLLFADGGLLALGANMGLVATVSGYAVFHVVRRWLPGLRGQVAAMAFAGWCSTVLAAIGCAGQLAWSGTVAWPVAFTAMTGIHLLIGVGEGAISALVLLAIARTRPDLVGVAGPMQTPLKIRAFVGYGLAVILGLGWFVAPFACSWPDGLESVAIRLGFARHAATPLLNALAPDYRIPGITSPVIATAVAAAVGVVVVFGLAVLLSRALVREPRETAGAPASPS
jgi:cobalt/nickel transport system permease protein